MATINVTDDKFQSDVLESDKPVLVDFWAEWCGPCKMIAPALEELSDEMKDQVTIAKMDIMENTGVPGQMGVQSIPYLVLFKNGEPAAQMRGAPGQALAAARGSHDVDALLLGSAERREASVIHQFNAARPPCAWQGSPLRRGRER